MCIALSTLFSDIVRTPNTKSKFPGLATLMELYLIMPISTACCERGFSCMKRIKKKDWRASGVRSSQEAFWVQPQPQPARSSARRLGC